MAQVNLTLNQDEILLLLASGDSSAAFRELLTNSLNQFLAVESAAKLGADPYERTEGRQDQRNGSRERPLTTRIWTLVLSVPRHRRQPYHTMLFDNYQRNEAALITTMAEMVIGGVSTRKVSRVMEELCGKEFSKSAVSEACKKLDPEVEAFRNRPIDPGRYPFLMVDATYSRPGRTTGRSPGPLWRPSGSPEAGIGNSWASTSSRMRATPPGPHSYRA